MKALGGAVAAALGAAVLTVMTIVPAAATTQTWKPIQAPGPVADSTGYHLAAVDCWSAGNCVAVGYRSSNGTVGSFIDRETNGAWSYVPVTAEAELTAVSCPAAGACVAVGTLGPYSSDPEGVVEVQSGTTWTPITATGPEGLYASYTGMLTGVSCAAAGSCAAVGEAASNAGMNTGFLLTLEPGNDPTKPASWVATKAPEKAGDAPYENAGLTAVSCVGAGNCRAVGFAHDDSNVSDTIPLIDQEKNYVWTYGGSPLPSGGQNGSLTSVACIKGGTTCMASGDYNGNQLPFTATVNTTNDTSQAQGDGLASPFTSGELSATSCAADGQCQSVGEAYANSGVHYGYNGFIVSERYGAGANSGTATVTDNPAGTNTIQHNETLFSTSCVSGGFCVSVGSYVTTSDAEASVIDTRTYDGTGAITGETDIRAPEPANDTSADDQNRLLGVDCNDSSHCAAVGSYFNDTDNSRGVIDTLGTAAAPAPTVTAISPVKGPTAGGTTVTVTGAHLAGATKVTFGSAAGTHLHLVSAVKLTVQAPRHAAGRVDVRVTTAAGTSAVVTADHYTFVAAPTVTSLSPTSGTRRGGTSVTVNGTNLSGATKASFGGTAGTHLTVVSATRLRVTSPAHARGAVDVRVTTAGGTSGKRTADHFTYK